MEKGIVDCSGIDTDAKWGYSHTKDGYLDINQHLTSTTGSLIVPFTADITTANVADNNMYVPLTSSSSSIFSLPIIHHMVADPGYDNKELYRYSKNTLRIDIVCPVERYEI
jgi:hypothetical protein